MEKPMSRNGGIDIHDVFMGDLEAFRYLISSSYNAATLFIVIAFVLTAFGMYWALLLLLPAAMMVGVAEVNVARQYALTLEYMRRCGLDVSDAPKPLFHSLRQWLHRA
jgi:hypothetical protein